MRLRLPVFVLLFITVLESAPVLADEEVQVITALPATYSISRSLTYGTNINVRNIPERGRRMNTLVNFFSTRAGRYAGTFSSTDAVVTIGKLWREDPLYTAARSVNIRVVEIDATKPWSTSLTGVAVIREPQQNVAWSKATSEQHNPSIFFWLSPANGARMADILAGDFVRLSPGDSERIEDNLVHFRKQLLDLKQEYEVKLSVLPDVTVFALTPEFVYLTSDMGIYVDGYFFRQDIDWTTTDLENFESYLKGNNIRVVIHKWNPSNEIRQRIDSAGAHLVVLDTIDGGIVEDGKLQDGSYMKLMHMNLEALYQALKRVN